MNTHETSAILLPLCLVYVLPFTLLPRVSGATFACFPLSLLYRVQVTWVLAPLQPKAACLEQMRHLVALAPNSRPFLSGWLADLSQLCVGASSLILGNVVCFPGVRIK